MMKRTHLAGLLAAALATALLFAFGAGCRKPEGQRPPDAPLPPTSAVPAGGKSTPSIAYWTCSMHPQIRAEKPGNCPICGMTLVPVRTAASAADASASVAGGDEVRLLPEAIHQAGVRIEKAQRRQLSKEVVIFGTIGYNLNLHRDVVSLVEGRVERQWVDFNQTEVAKDAPLVTLYSPESMVLQEDYLKALRERWLSTFYERKLLGSMVTLAGEKLRRIGFTDEDLARLQRERKAQAEVVVRAPIAGTIVDNQVHLGEIVKAGQALYHLAPIDVLWFNAQVFEPDLGLLRNGQEVRITTKADPGKESIGRLIFIGRSLDPVSRTVPVRFAVPNPDRKLLPNLSADGRLMVPLGENIPSVPNSAVLDLGLRHVVYVQKEPGVYAARNVRIGQATEHFTQILEGVEEGAEVVVAGAFLIDAQAQLRGGSGASTAAPSEPAPLPSEHHH